MAPLVVSPTGSGKTVMFAFIANNAMQSGKRCLIIVHRIEILQQTMKALMSFGIQSGTIASGRPMTTDKIQVAMVSTLAHRMDQIITPDIIITDEAHHSVAGQWMKVQKQFTDTFRIGFTATPERLSGEGLILCFDTMIEGPTTKWLVDNKFLSRPRVFVGPDVRNVAAMKKYHTTRGDFDKAEQVQEMKKRNYVGNVIDHYKKHLDGLPTVCFCVSIEHCNIMREEFRRFGYRAETVHGGMKKSERDKAINGLGTGEVQVVCSCDVISEGVDVPVIAGVILLRRTKSLGLYLQQVGRALRLYPGKEYAIILDHAGNSHIHGLPLDERDWSLFSKKRNERDSIKLPNQTVCIACGGVFPGKVIVCPDCGCNIEEETERRNKDRTPEEIEGELHEVNEQGKVETEVRELTEEAERIRALDPAERQKEMLASLRRNGNNDKSKELARAVGYKDNWTNYIYNKKIVRRSRMEVLERLLEIGFLTGSRAYGTNEKDSDYDIVITITRIQEAYKIIEGIKITPSEYFNGFYAQVEGIKINIIPVHPDDFNGWIIANEAMKAIMMKCEFMNKREYCVLYESIRAVASICDLKIKEEEVEEETLLLEFNK